MAAENDPQLANKIMGLNAASQSSSLTPTAEPFPLDLDVSEVGLQQAAMTTTSQTETTTMPPIAPEHIPSATPWVPSPSAEKLTYVDDHGVTQELYLDPDEPDLSSQPPSGGTPPEAQRAGDDDYHVSPRELFEHVRNLTTLLAGLAFRGDGVAAPTAPAAPAAEGSELLAPPAPPKPELTRKEARQEKKIQRRHDAEIAEFNLEQQRAAKKGKEPLLKRKHWHRIVGAATLTAALLSVEFVETTIYHAEGSMMHVQTSDSFFDSSTLSDAFAPERWVIGKITGR